MSFTSKEVIPSLLSPVRVSFGHHYSHIAQSIPEQTFVDCVDFWETMLGISSCAASFRFGCHICHQVMGYTAVCVCCCVTTDSNVDVFANHVVRLTCKVCTTFAHMLAGTYQHVNMYSYVYVYVRMFTFK